MNNQTLKEKSHTVKHSIKKLISINGGLENAFGEELSAEHFTEEEDVATDGGGSTYSLINKF
jgi:hypothetical protein